MINIPLPTQIKLSNVKLTKDGLLILNEEMRQIAEWCHDELISIKYIENTDTISIRNIKDTYKLNNQNKLILSNELIERLCIFNDIELQVTYYEKHDYFELSPLQQTKSSYGSYNNQNQQNFRNQQKPNLKIIKNLN